MATAAPVAPRLAALVGAEVSNAVDAELRVPSANDREQSLLTALARAKDLIRELRARVVRADSVAVIWTTVPRHPDLGNARDAEVECGAIMRRVLCADGDVSLRAALDELKRRVG